MYILLILFFASLTGIIVMIGRKMVSLEDGPALSNEEVFLEVPHLEKVKRHIVKNIKKYGHLGVIGILETYFRSTKLLKTKYQEIKNGIRNSINKSQANGEKHEISRFLKVVSDYKQKIRDLKHKIHEEDKNGEKNS